MTKTQIQVPDPLLAEIREFAKRREWSLAETFRRGAELLLETYPEDGSPASEAWQPPTSARVGWNGLTGEQLRDVLFDDSEARLP